MMNKILALLALVMVAGSGLSQNSYLPYKSFDGEHKNEVAGYVLGGDNVIVGKFGGIAASYKRHITPRWYVGGDIQEQFGKQQFAFDITGGYRLPVKYGNIYFDAKAMFNRYNRWATNENSFNLSGTWESAYFDMRLGASIIYFHMSSRWGDGYGYTEPITLTCSFGANMRHRNNPWNIGLFIRNYDDFYYENWNINWGIRWYAKVKDQWHLFGEFNVRPAGSLSQLASRYEGSLKLGLKYKW